MGFAPGNGEKSTDERRHVLFIAVDDLRPALGCAGVPFARTPHLDALAEQGVLCSQHFVQVPTCGASRYALWTGRSPARSRGMHNNAFYGGPSALGPEGEGAQTLPELARRHGYRTVAVGKLSHTPDGQVYAYDGSGDGRPEMPGAWDRLETPFGPWKRGWGSFFAYADGRHREDGLGHSDLWEFEVDDDDALPDGLIASRAVELIGELAQDDAPFFLGVGFYKPHLPWVAPRKDWDAFADVGLPTPAAEPVDSPHRHKSGEFFRYRRTFPKADPLAPGDAEMCRRAYFACVRYVDRQIGRVLAALDQHGLAERTLVVVWGDHGWHLGESGLWGKHTLFERAVHSALLMRGPGIPAGRTCDALVETLDLYPTIAEWCGLDQEAIAHPLDGRSLGPLFRGESDAVRDAAVSYWGKSVSVRTTSHRLIATRGADGEVGRVELAAMADGPDPVRDRAADEPDLVRRMLDFLPD